MDLRQVYNSKTISSVHTEVASNKIPFLGAGLFPNDKKMGLDLKWIKTSKGLGVSLKPSNFDAKSTIRSREGFKMAETEMAFFRESMLLKEADRQEILRASDANDPYVQSTIKQLFDDADVLVDGAEIVAERMRMQLLAPADGHPSISIQADGVTYAYNYDPAGTYAEKNFVVLESASDKWTDHENSDPLADVDEGVSTVESATGTKVSYMLVSKATMRHLKQNKNIKNAILAQNGTANLFMTEAKVKELFKNELGIDIVIYNKMFKDEEGTVSQFYPDGFATLLPEGSLGKTWHGTTPEEADLLGKADVDVTILPSGTAIKVKTEDDPVQTKTTVSDIILPSYERMDETYVIKCY